MDTLEIALREQQDLVEKELYKYDASLNNLAPKEFYLNMNGNMKRNPPGGMLDWV